MAAKGNALEVLDRWEFVRKRLTARGYGDNPKDTATTRHSVIHEAAWDRAVLYAWLGYAQAPPFDDDMVGLILYVDEKAYSLDSFRPDADKGKPIAAADQRMTPFLVLVPQTLPMMVRPREAAEAANHVLSWHMQALNVTAELLRMQGREAPGKPVVAKAVSGWFITKENQVKNRSAANWAHKTRNLLPRYADYETRVLNAMEQGETRHLWEFLTLKLKWTTLSQHVEFDQHTHATGAGWFDGDDESGEFGGSDWEEVLERVAPDHPVFVEHEELLADRRVLRRKLRRVGRLVEQMVRLLP